MAKRKDLLNAALKALLAGVEVTAFGKITATFIAELAALPADEKKKMAGLGQEEFEKLLVQSEMASYNAAVAAVGVGQIKKMVCNSFKLSKKELTALSDLTQEEFERISVKLDGIDETTKDTNAAVKEMKAQLDNIGSGDQVNDDGIVVKGNAKVNVSKGSKVEGDQNIGCEIKNVTVNVALPKTEPEAPSGAIHNIPRKSIGGLFKGRDGDYGKLVKQLDDKDGAAAITQAIAGLGGMGKTQLAVEYGWRGLAGGDYQAVLFVNCSQEIGDREKTDGAEQQQGQQDSAVERLFFEMGKLGDVDLLNIDGVADMKPQTAVKAVIKELRGRDKWLVVFDNVDEPAMAAAVSVVLPQLDKGKVIITSRLKNFSGGIGILELEKLTEKASIEYLLDKTEGKRIAHDDDQEKVEELAGKLDGLPVALEQAAAFINYRKISFEAYLDKFEVMEGKLLRFKSKESELNKDFKPVLTVWTLTEEQLDPAARAIITLAAFMAAEAIPVSLFVNQADGVLEAAGELDSDFNIEKYKGQLQIEKADVVEDAIAQLGGYSMISRDASGGCFSIHRLVQEATRLR
ncbi:MAG: hypothetical protein KAS23_14545, partial [Anaerohalosphaera sp.]|nr:hypothetical protein [Anaerohalosphaera sp.]